jgi:hypothetical protein
MSEKTKHHDLNTQGSGIQYSIILVTKCQVFLRKGAEGEH